MALLQNTKRQSIRALCLGAFAVAAAAGAWAQEQVCNKTVLFKVKEQQWQGMGTVKNQTRYQIPGKNGFFFTSGMSIDADGSPRAFHPISSKGLDDLKNAGHPGNWWGILTNTRETNGKPIVQGPNDPAPGYYISQTGLEDKTKSETSPLRYADAEKLPYIVLSGTNAQNLNAQYGDYVVVYNAENGKYSLGLYGDSWPTLKIGEGSVAMAKELGVDANPRTGGADGGITYLVFPRSRSTPWRAEESLGEIRAEAQKHLQTWGGLEQLKACLR